MAQTPSSDMAAYLEQLLNPRQAAMQMRQRGVPEPEMVQKIIEMLMNDPAALAREQNRIPVNDINQEQEMFENPLNPELIQKLGPEFFPPLNRPYNEEQGDESDIG